MAGRIEGMTFPSGGPDGLFDESLVNRVEPTTDVPGDANGGRKKRFKAFEPGAVMLVPPSLDEWLPQEHLSRFIAELVDEELDLDRFYASYAKAKGQPPYDPRLMLRIALYGYCTGVRSSRELEKACTDVVAFRWLAAGQAPDFRSIGRFRERHLAALANVFLQALELCRAAGMVKLGQVALDGTKVRANASRHKAMSYARLTQKQKVLADEISDLMAEARTVDKDEDARYGPGKRGDELPVELANRHSVLQRCRRLGNRWRPKPRTKPGPRLRPKRAGVAMTMMTSLVPGMPQLPPRCPDRRRNAILLIRMPG